ncbi:MAG: glycosyltransferase family 2 protein, partial [Clostridia bacterium]|nr:glycosyltransferase family 2 protein [Clostridia bacterium]
LESCLRSIYNQSFKKYEVLMIDDGSTDSSGMICQKWEKYDIRFRYYKKNNEGPSLTRNYGMDRALGKYLSFIDADDWIDENFLEYLYKAIKLEDADLAECDFYRVNNDNGKQTVRICYGCMGRVYSKEERIERGHTAIWKCLYKKSLWIKNDVKFPNAHSQARGVYALLVALSNRVASVRKPLYYYRKFRKESLSEQPRVNIIDKNAEGIQSYKTLLDGFKKHGIFEQYNNTLMRMIIYKSSDSLAGFFLLRSERDFQELRVNYKDFVYKQFPQNKFYTYVTFGGYNLNRITWNMNQLHDPYLRFNFSSIISIMNPVKGLTINHCNRYRKIMIDRDVLSTFWEIIERESIDYIILDLLEERFDIMEINGGFITKSDALDTANIVDLKKERIISRNSEECFALWKSSCRKFIKKLSSYIPVNHIILVKNYLSRRKGDLNETVLYGNISKIDEINDLLEQYYCFFSSQFTGVKIIEVLDLPHYYTDKEYEYGAIPSHLNDIVNIDISSMIENELNINGE